MWAEGRKFWGPVIRSSGLQNSSCLPQPHSPPLFYSRKAIYDSRRTKDFCKISNNSPVPYFLSYPPPQKKSPILGYFWISLMLVGRTIYYTSSTPNTVFLGKLSTLIIPRTYKCVLVEWRYLYGQIYPYISVIFKIFSRVPRGLKKFKVALSVAIFGVLIPHSRTPLAPLGRRVLIKLNNNVYPPEDKSYLQNGLSVVCENFDDPKPGGALSIIWKNFGKIL